MIADRLFMRRALRLAARGVGCVSPNPLVGAVIVRDGRIVAQGWHRAVGREHAEVDALRQAGDDARGADLFVNLEPCCHFGRTPPCTRAVIAAGIRRVVVAHVDPNPLVAGKGVAALRAAGVVVEVGLLEAEARELNAAFLKWISTGRPLVTLKMAMTLDGRTADRDGGSHWITSVESRREVHRMRAHADAVMVGAGTASRDDPLLLPVLFRSRRKPLRVVVDEVASLSLSSRLVATALQSPVLVATTDAADESRVQALAGQKVQIAKLPALDGGIDIEALLTELGRRSIGSLLVEGGPTLAATLLRNDLVDRLVLFVAPRLLGDPMALPLVGDLGLRDLAAARSFCVKSIRSVGPDVRIDLAPDTPVLT